MFKRRKTMVMYYKLAAELGVNAWNTSVFSLQIGKGTPNVITHCFQT